MRENDAIGTHWLISPYVAKWSRKALIMEGWKNVRGTCVITSEFVGSIDLGDAKEFARWVRIEISGMSWLAVGWEVVVYCFERRLTLNLYSKKCQWLHNRVRLATLPLVADYPEGEASSGTAQQQVAA